VDARLDAEEGARKAEEKQREKERERERAIVGRESAWEQKGRREWRGRDEDRAEGGRVNTYVYRGRKTRTASSSGGGEGGGRRNMRSERDRANGWGGLGRVATEEGQAGEEGIAEKRQEGGYSRLHPRGSGPSVSPWQPTLKHPPAVVLPSHRRELRFPMAVIMYPRSREREREREKDFHAAGLFRYTRARREIKARGCMITVVFIFSRNRVCLRVE